MQRLLIRADGAARGNPGPAAAGAVLIDADQHSSYILKGILMSAGHDVVVAGDPDAALLEAHFRLTAEVVQEQVDKPLLRSVAARSCSPISG